MQVSTWGGSHPRWQRDSKELFYISPVKQMMAAELSIKGASVEVGRVQALFGGLNAEGRFEYDVALDGQHFLAVVAPEQTAQEPLTLVQNWTRYIVRMCVN